MNLKSLPLSLSLAIAALGLATLAQAQPSNLIITGLYDGPLGTAPRGVELYVINNIPDLSDYGVGSANNGEGTDGEEFSFPAVSASAGDFIYVTNDSIEFINFFGFSPDYENAVAGINGNDAFEVYRLGAVVDIFGLVDVDGTGTPWEWLDGWAYRSDCTGPDGTTFVLTNWLYSGINVFDGETTNATSSVPFPLATYDRDCPTGTAAKLVLTEIMYNSPQLADIEFLEIYNNEAVPVDLEGYVFVGGIADTLPAFVLNPGEYYVLTDEAAGFLATYGFAADHQWSSGTLSNTGETIRLQDTAGLDVFLVTYADGGDWSSTADGFGPSLILCDVDSDNDDPDNWQRSINDLGVLEDGVAIYASPGDDDVCPDDPVVTLGFAEVSFLENIGTVQLFLYLDNADSDATSVDVTIASGGTASEDDDYLFSSTTVTFPAFSDSAQFVSLTLVDDALTEASETFFIQLSNPTNNAVLATDRVQVTILDDETLPDASVILIGIFHGPLSGAPKGVELVATADIADLSLYGLGCANNGEGTDGVEWNFPVVSVTAGNSFYVVNDTAVFRDFFGFSADFQDDGIACNFNGDDAFEVFEGATGIDVFGDINVDGSGEPWEYTLSWAHRIAGGPDGTNFVLSNWEFAELNVFDGALTNDDASNPYPAGEINIFAETPARNPLALYPNPTNGHVVVTSSAQDVLRIYDLTGKEVFRTAVYPGSNVLNFSLNSGIYLVHLQEAAARAKLIVE
ncbi:MAG: T9SS type A sorting domain-containing protein [Bacteroidetes bacterium]|nr:T9SS type A sorting domain-containing protein [Bacteroidota bacterium]